ncbi:MAG: hypothetical protein ACFFHD_07165 [Promethearchaeota archaeon]
MNQTRQNIEKIRKVPINHLKLLKEIINKLNKIFLGKREIMYSDIINLISREGNSGEDYNQILLWCNHKIRLGEFFLEV